MAKKKLDSQLTLQRLQQELLQLSCDMQMTTGTSTAWKHVVRAAQHCTLGLLWSLDPEDKQMTAEMDRFTTLAMHGARGGVEAAPMVPPPIVKRA